MIEAVILAALAVWAGFAVRSIIKQKKAGKGCCGGDCARCAGCCEQKTNCGRPENRKT